MDLCPLRTVKRDCFYFSGSWDYVGVLYSETVNKAQAFFHGKQLPNPSLRSRNASFANGPLTNLYNKSPYSKRTAAKTRPSCHTKGVCPQEPLILFNLTVLVPSLISSLFGEKFQTCRCSSNHQSLQQIPIFKKRTAAGRKCSSMLE